MLKKKRRNDLFFFFLNLQLFFFKYYTNIKLKQNEIICFFIFAVKYEDSCTKNKSLHHRV